MHPAPNTSDKIGAIVRGGGQIGAFVQGLALSRSSLSKFSLKNILYGDLVIKQNNNIIILY